MGKDKQRTKGGVKPSSSGRTAELLFKSQDGSVGFGGQNVFASYVPVIPTFGAGDFDSANSTLSAELRLLLRKLSKKDATTKLKALAELLEIFGQNAEVCNEVLQYWPRLYSKLTMDDSRKVREVCHCVLEVLGKQVGRNLAPQLKSLAPYWYLGQHDIFAPAASSATKSFNAVFSTEKKRNEAIQFCREEIFGLISENLTVPPKKQEQSDENDSEPLSLRLVFSSLSGLTKLIDSEVVEEVQLQSLMDSTNFWALTKHSSSVVRRELFNLVTMVANKKPALIQRQCIKAITQSLREETSECLQSLWNCFLTLTLNCDAFTSDPNLTKSQLLKVCRQGFYGNATSLGPAVLPLVAKIGIDEPLVRQLLPALQSGYASEKSLSEKCAILRAYGETLAYFISTNSSDISSLSMEVVFPFVESLIKEGNTLDFGQTLGNLIKKEEFFALLSQWISLNIESLNGRNLGNFIVSLCANNKNKPQAEAHKKAKSVKFAVDQPAEELLNCFKYEDLSASKKLLVISVVKSSMESSKLETIMIISSQFNSATLYNEATDNKPGTIVESSAFENSDDMDAKLSLVLDLIQTFPEIPSFLSKLSSLFESDCGKISRLKNFTTRIKIIKHLPSIARWLKQDIFCDKIRNIINSSDYSDEDSLAIVRFMLENSSLFPLELLDGIVASLCSHLESLADSNDRFVKDVLRLVTALSEKNNNGSKLKAVMSQIWERLVRDVGTASDPEAQEQVQYLIDQFVAVSVQGGLLPTELCSAVQKEVDSVTSVPKIDKLVKLAQSLVDEIHYTPMFSLRLDSAKVEDLLNFLNLSFFPLKDSTMTNYESVREQLKLSFLSRSIFEAKFALKAPDEISDFVNPVVKILYAQAVCNFWKELEKYDVEKCVQDELYSELGILTTRWLEVLAEDNWNKWSQQVVDQLSKPHRDVFLTSKLMLNVFLETTEKMELATSVQKKPLNEFIQQDSVSLSSENVLDFIGTLLKDYLSFKPKDVTAVVDYLNVQRKDFSQQFNFDRIFYHLDLESQKILLGVVDVVIGVLREIEGDEADEFYTNASCWVSGWLKQCKKLPPELNKAYFLWISKLAVATQLIADYARKSPKFTAEYIEFHASNLYLPFYYIFLQLGPLGLNDFSVVRTTENVGIALASVPSTTLNFIQPVSSQICASFAPYLESDRSSLKIAAYRILRKIKPKPSGGQDADEVPIVPVEFSEIIRKYGEEISVREITRLDDQQVFTFLLCWDALLTMHADRSCNEFGSFSKEPHLLPQLLSILFFQLIDLIAEPKFPVYFENSLTLQPDQVPPPFGHLVCSVLQKALQCLPYPTRWWWNSQLSKQRDKTMVEKFIIKFLSSKLAAEELGKVQWTDSDNVTVQSHPGCNELIAHYKFEDTTVSLTVTLPLNHPLGPISVKISDKKLLGKISHLLNNKSNSLVAGLQLWKEHLDAKYSGHEECAICFFIVHGPTKSLPKMTCGTCNHKFHSACLLKWFSTSNKSECPLCRNLF